jgi:O-acetyl-ADP-ribose deacetylase (regulator of RNase III)
MKHVKGDLILGFSEGDFDVIVHGCNCGNNMGDGIARTIKEKYPEAYEADCRTVRFDKTKLGTYTHADIYRDLRNSDGVRRGVFLGTIINAYTQFHWYGKGVLCDYDALRSVFRQLKPDYGNQGKSFGVPAIGAARAGGDWRIISAIIDEELEGEEVIFVEYNGVDAVRGDYKRNMR